MASFCIPIKPVSTMIKTKTSTMHVNSTAVKLEAYRCIVFASFESSGKYANDAVACIMEVNTKGISNKNNANQVLLPIKMLTIAKDTRRYAESLPTSHRSFV
mmetsp:Transcript_22825/g.32689  ORF Transcript_22825/g.32689 Transcript_22825/m.32689 type:complete len:102 (+) Transcript_22825:490-795(+)